MSFETDKHLRELDDLNMSVEAKRALIHSLKPWAQAFVAWSFGDLPAHHIQPPRHVADSKDILDALKSYQPQTPKEARHE